ncbi:WS/DGAT/MGAT family O-acyltransferase [Nocardioides insulae]|uniref:WS/DGAT/MGAT family O-acyltransferase n=1 Tax=Nocardioides insulae TaxID=394734 RepID=UPI00040692F4|nr:wax ester/triacylglycerol synthase family O-acyltransferase [Nocardioides insulae]
MGERLTPRDAGLLRDESETAPRTNATVQIFDPGGSGGEPGLAFDALLDLVAERLEFLPRYRKRVQVVPGRLAHPVWVDDPGFDLDYHVRRSAVPRPGGDDQLRDLVARIVSRPLDRSRPLWEAYLVEGLAGGRVALLTKTHQVLVDGVDTVDLGQLLLDNAPDRRPLGEEAWAPRGTPSSLALVLDAVQDNLTNPGTLRHTVEGAGTGVLRGMRRSRRRVARVARTVVGRTPSRPTPIGGRLSRQRRVTFVETELSAYQRVREAHGGSVNDVVLAVVAGGLRGWLMTRAESLAGLRTIRALVPVSVLDEELEATSMGTQIAPHLVDLPIGEPSAVVRLHQVSYSFEKHRASERAVPAQRLAGYAGFAPTTFHAMGARVAAAQPRSFQISVVNVPGPQSTLYAAGAPMTASYPVHPLLPGHALAVGVTSYDGKVFFGITADRDLVPDDEVLGQCLREALDELDDTTSGRRRLRRGRRSGKIAP